MSISYSELQTYLDCQIHWYMIYKLGRREENPHLTFGAMAHEVLETRLIPEEFEYSDLKNFFGITSWKDYFTFIMREIDELLKDYDVLYREYHFENEFLKGIIDCVLKHKTTGKILLIDYKFVTKEKDYDDITSDQQLYIYALSWVMANPQYTIDDVSVGYISIPKKNLDDVRVLKNGALSKDKAQFVTYNKYLEKIHELHLNEDDYQDILNDLKTKEILKLVMTSEINIKMLTRIVYNIENTLRDMNKGYLLEKYPCKSYNCPCNEFLRTNPEINLKGGK